MRLFGKESYFLTRNLVARHCSLTQCQGKGMIKLRVSVGLAIALGTVLISALFALLLVATDYGRLHISSYITRVYLSRISGEVKELVSENKKLVAQLNEVKGENTRIAAYKTKVHQRLELLSSIISSAAPLDPFHTHKGIALSKRTEQDRANERVEGIGGAEVIVEPNVNTLSDKSLTPKEGLGARLSRLFKHHEKISDQALLDELDRYAEVVRHLPLGSPGMGWVSSGFGTRRSPFTNRVSRHEGIDILLPAEGEVVSSADGKVLEVERNATYGLTVLIEHTPRIKTRYAHLLKVLVNAGDSVCLGEAIGLAGSSGRSTGPHLHYEILLDDTAIDPMKFMNVLERIDPKELVING